MNPGSRSVKTASKLSLRKLGIAIRERRQELDLSQEDLAERCHLHRTYISGIERGVRNPTVTCIDDVARALNIDLAELVKRSARVR
jgi:transcriptional regulator with XRE-family HTH domain